jgi:hypothetical protein
VWLRVTSPVPGRCDGRELLDGAFQGLHDPIVRRHTHYALFHGSFTLWLILFPVDLDIFILDLAFAALSNWTEARWTTLTSIRVRNYRRIPSGGKCAPWCGFDNAVAASLWLR